MKTKIFALIAAILCFSMLATSCFKKDCEEHVDEDNDSICDVCEAEIKAAPVDTVACAEHKDENADKICDVCGGAIVVITQLQKPDVADRVPMVVKPMPTDVNLSDYLLLNKPAAEDVTVTKQDNSWTSASGSYYYYRTVDSYYVEHKIVDVESNNVIFSQKVDYETYGDRMEINLYADCYTVEIRNYTSNNNNYYYATHRELSVYTYGKVMLDTVKWTADVDNYNYNYDKDGISWTTYKNQNLIINGYSDYTYVRIGDVVYIIDSESKTVIETMQSDVYVARPTFTMKNDDYGIVVLNGYLYSYNLNKWIACVSSFQLPTSGSNRYWMLDNGKILVQNVLTLEDRAVSYDYIDNYGEKFDISYTVYDPATGNAENIEFGYYIDSISAISEENAVYDGTKDLNGASVYAIVNDRLVRTSISILVNSDLDILLNTTEMFGRNTTWSIVANNRFLVIESYSNNLSRMALYNENGVFIAYVPNEAIVYSSCIYFDGKYYDFDMNLVLDPEEKGYTVYSNQNDYMILRDDNDYYYFDGKTDPQRIRLQTGESLSYVGKYGYIISYQNYTGSRYEYYTVIYSANNTKVKTLNDFNVNNVYDNYDGSYRIYGYSYSSGSGMSEYWVIK